MVAPTKLYVFCSLAMAALFFYSASVQLNDPDWYFWLPLYSGACVFNLLLCFISSKTIKNLAKATLCLGIFLFIKVVVEDFRNEISGFVSLDLSERVVREKIGSGLVVMSMVLQLLTSQAPQVSMIKDRNKFPRYVDCGMAILVGFSFGLPLVFFGFQKGDMIF